MHLKPATERVPKPDWLKVRAPGGASYAKIKSLLSTLKLNTVCEQARCPNVAECWGAGTATVMLMGDTCTRACKFCHVKSGNPQGVLDDKEPEKVAEAISELGLSYVVLTSVDRDDLSDGGAEHFAKTVERIKNKSPQIIVEVLIPDFLGLEGALYRIGKSGADVIAHNLETVKRLTKAVRDIRCDYQRSLDVLKYIKQHFPRVYTKSSLMLGLGEIYDEVMAAMDDLRAIQVDVLTIGQYLRPAHWNLPVQKYIHPETFKALGRVGLEKGFLCVPSGPLVRSSYRAGEKFLEAKIREDKCL